MAKILRSRIPRFLSRAALATSASTLAVVMAQAHAALGDDITFDIPAQSLSEALLAFSRQSDVVVTAPFGLVEGKQAPAVDGQMQPGQALLQLLSGSGLKAVSGKHGALVVQSDQHSEPPIRLAATRLPVLAAVDADIHPTANPSATPDDSGWALQEVIVTARRKSEALEDVPQTVSAVTADTVQKLNILNFQDLQTIVPGLAIGVDPSGVNDTISMRGLTYSVFSQNVLPTVALYMNDSLLGGPQYLFQSMFDIGQIEVLRGPQGTLHGEPAPSGAITLTTRKPDLSQFGGYADVTGYSENNLDGPATFDAQAAINTPLIKDVLGLRLAGVVENNHLDLVRSLSNPAKPYSRTKSGRATLTFEPTDALGATFMYQHLESNVRNFAQVIGTGSAGGTFPPPPRFPGFPFKYTAPAVVAPGYNGPPITADERLSVEDAPRLATQKYDLVTGQIDWRFAGQRLAYVGNYGTFAVKSHTAQDIGNLLPGNDYSTQSDSEATQQVHELRLMSEERLLGLFDYTLGASYRRFIGTGNPTQQYSQFLPGAFGTGAAPNPYVFNSADLVPLLITTIPLNYERSLFFNGTVHLGDHTELSAGVRRINFGYRSTSSYTLVLFGKHIPLTLFPNPDYGSKPTIYNVSLSHHFTDNLLVYATTGSAWRPGTTVIGPTNATNDPTLGTLINLHSEYSHSYELGVKSLFLDRRAQVNFSLYHQYFRGLVFQSQYAPYLIVTPIPGTSIRTTSISANNFTTNANSVVNGVDMDGSFRVTPRWTVAGAFSYSDGHVDNAKTPCTPPGVDINNPTVASFQAAVTALGQPGALVYLCNSKQPISTAPSWNTSIQSEYSRPLAKRLDGYVRGLLTYYPSNPNALQGYDVPSYALANLYVGVRDPDSSWEITLFAKNLTNRFVLLSKSYFQIQEQAGLNAIFGFPGYYNNVQVTSPREVGLNLRYTIGSR